MLDVDLKTLSDDAVMHHFATVLDVWERKQLLTELITRKMIPKQADSNTFLAGWERMLDDAKDYPEDMRRLMSLAETVRAVQAMKVAKKWQERLLAALPSILAKPLPSLTLLLDADDRLNVARACNWAADQRLQQYCAQSIADEDKSKNTCQELVQALAKYSNSLAEMVTVLAHAFRHTQIDTEEQGDTLSRRLAQALNAFRTVIIESELEAGADFGKAFEHLAVTTVRLGGLPKSDKARADFSKEVLLTLHDVVRTRFSISTDPSVYTPLHFIRRMNGPSAWPAELERELGLLVKDVSEAILLLGKQGVCDPALLEQLTVLCNYPERARALAKSLAQKHPELPESVRDWLSEGRMRQRVVSETAQEEVAKNADLTIGFALIEAKKASDNSTTISSNLVSTLEIYEPHLAVVAAGCFSQFEALVVQVEQLARQRSLTLLGQVGERVDAAPKFYEWVASPMGQYGIVRRPAVVRLRPDGALGDVVIKGLIE